MTRYVLALDQGTTSSRALLFDDQGRHVATSQQEFAQHFPQPGWVEHDAEDIWHSQINVARQVLQKQGIAASEVAAIGITNQRETSLLWERNSGRPLAPAIVWQDRRTADACQQLRAAGHESMVQQKTGLLLDPYFSATKLKWLLDNVPGARARARRGELAFGTVDSWLLWRLTDGAVHATDASNASRTLLYNLHTQDWDDQLLALLDIPRALLPQIRSSSEIYGHTASHWLGGAIPIAGCAGDQQAACFGQACFAPGMAKNTYGTGGFLLLNTGEQVQTSQHRLLSSVAWQRNGQTCHALEGSIFMAGAIVQWLRDGLGIIHQASEIEALAASVPDSDGVTLIPAFTGMGAPWWQPQTRASITGLSRNSTRAHIARAALEAIAQQVADVFEAMQQDSGGQISELRVDGGAASNNLLLQLQTDLLGIPVVRPRITETTALGAAYLAGLAVGLWSSSDELEQLWQMERRFTPTLQANERQRRRQHWQRTVSHALGEPGDH